MTTTTTDRIEVTAEHDEIRLRFPIDLNPPFKDQFKTARWNPDARVWAIKNHPQNRNKVDRWVAEVEATDLLRTIRLAKEIEQDELDLSRVRSELTQLQKRLERSRDLTAALGEVKAALAEAKAALEAVRGEAARAVRAAEGQRVAVMAKLEGVIDLKAVQAAQTTMVRQGKLVGATAKDAYHAAQATVAGWRDKLAGAGFSSAGLNRLARASFNRQDRDDPSKVSLDDILDIRPLPPPED